jgi:monofunctional biosynthetic peptidoglycan transglycosylase
LGASIRTTLRAATAIGAVGFALLAYVYLTLPDVRPLATVNPTTTAFMEMRARQARASGKRLRHQHRWVPYSRISPNLRRAVLAAEDSAFFDHEGIDYAEIRKAVEDAIAKGTEIRGASTLTQQLAKNLYLSPSRDPLRKLRELIITRRLEANLSKARIFEIYLNVVEWGDGIWGVEAASRAHFGVSAAALTRPQAALLAGSLINPIVYSPSRPPGRLLRRQQIILARMGAYEPPAPEAPPPAVVPAGVEPVVDPALENPPVDPGTAEPAPEPLGEPNVPNPVPPPEPAEASPSNSLPPAP